AEFEAYLRRISMTCSAGQIQSMAASGRIRADFKVDEAITAAGTEVERLAALQREYERRRDEIRGRSSDNLTGRVRTQAETDGLQLTRGRRLQARMSGGRMQLVAEGEDTPVQVADFELIESGRAAARERQMRGIVEWRIRVALGETARPTDGGPP